MILKVDKLDTTQFYDLVGWLNSEANIITVDQARDMGFQDDETVSEVTRDFYSRHADMTPDLVGVIRIISVKSKLVAGNTKSEADSYDIVLDVPQAIFLQQPYPPGRTRTTPRLVAIPASIVEGVMEILADNPNFIGDPRQ